MTAMSAITPPASCEVLIIGAGLAGSAAARRLARAGLERCSSISSRRGVTRPAS
jgi:flavin-dependent dehydrogenase